MHERRNGAHLPHPREPGRVREPAQTRATPLTAVAAAAAIGVVTLVAVIPGRAQEAPQSPELVVQTGHQQQIDVVAYSADSRLLASGDIRGSIRVWETTTGKQLFALPGHAAGLARLKFSQDGRLLASATSGRGGDGDVKLWDVATGHELQSWSFPEYSVTGLAISGDAALVAAASDVVRIWNVTSGEQIAEIPTDDRRITLAFDPRGSLLAIRDPSRVRFWTPSGLEMATVRLRNIYGDGAMVFLADGRKLAVPDGDRVVIVDVPARAAVGRIDLGDERASRLFSLANSATEIGVAYDFRYEAWDIERRKKVREITRDFLSLSDVPSPSFRWLTVLARGEVEDLEGGRAPWAFGDRIPAAGAVAFSRDGSRLATNTGRRFWVWDLGSGDPPRLFDGHSRLGNAGFQIDSLSFGAGERLVSTDPLFGLIEWDAAAGEITNSIAVPRPDDSALVNACSADGRWCVSGQRDRIEVRDADTWRVDRTFDTGAGRGIAVSDDGTWVATPVDDAAAVLDRRNGRVRRFEGHKDTSRVAFSLEGRLLASADFAGTVKIWDVESGRELRSFQSGHETGVTSLAFSPDGRVLATGGSDQTVQLWDPRAGELRYTLEGHADWVAALAFNPTGRLLASGSADGTIRLWDVQSGTAVALLTAARETPDWLVVTPDGYFDGSAGAENLVAWRIGTAAYSPESYFNSFFEPGVLARVARGAPAARVKIDGIVVPPLVRILESGGRTLQEPKLTLKMRAEGDVAEVSLYHNGARVATRSGSADVAGEYVFDLELIPGENELRGVAVSPAGVASNPDSIRLTYDAPAPARPVLYVLSVGVSRYQDPSWNLGQARADAEAIAAFFRDRSAKLFETVHVTVLADEQASRANIQAAIEAIGAAAQPQDVALVYFAGHGVAVDQTYYLLPHDMHNESSLEADVKKFGLSDRALLDSLRTVRALKKVVLLDACQSGGALDILGRAPAAERAALESLARAEGLFIIAASTRQQEAMEVRELGHGVFTYALLSGLGATGDATVPPVVTMHQLLAYVGQKVPELAARYGRTTRQVPVSLQRGMDFPLAVR